MFGAVMAFICGAMYVGDELKTASNTQEWKDEAVANREPVYMDGRGQMRSVQTNEIVFTRFIGKKFRGVQYEGVKSGKVYGNTVYQQVAEANKKLEKNGKKFRYKVFPQWKYDALPVDQEVGLPYISEIIRPMVYGKTISDGKVTLRYITNMNSQFPDWDLGGPRKIMTYNEGKCYIEY